MNQTNFSLFLRNIKNSPEISREIPFWDHTSSTKANSRVFPDWLEGEIRNALEIFEIHSLYSHQREAVEKVHAGSNVILSTGTASGKSLCYQLPILNEILRGMRSNAILVFPTKALANDQLNTINLFRSQIEQSNPELAKLIRPALFDGDTPSHIRTTIKDSANIILTNPDMLHLGILPHHTKWVNFFQNLRFIVLDEVHIYRGVFGSHVANIMRRLNRILDFYGTKETYVLTSATIANPVEHAEKLTGQPVDLVSEDGSPHGERNFIFFNPPIVNEELGIRQGVISTSLDFSKLILEYSVQSLLFTRSRRAVELIIHELRKLFPRETESIRGYRSGYLKNDRREIEQGLKNGSVNLAVATNALELGVDIGGVDLVVMAGYPGTITSTRQRAGRAGRKHGESAAIFIASASPLDQFLVRHPEFVMEKNPESALIDPNNPLILITQIQCAAFELAFVEGDSFGSIKWDELSQYLNVLAVQGFLVNRGSKFFWLADSYPAAGISLRSTATKTISLQTNMGNELKSIGEVDYASSLWMTHPGAVYLHEGETYLVESLDIENGIALLSATNVNFFTEPVKSQEIQVIRDISSTNGNACTIHFSEIEVTTRIESFKRVDWETRTILSVEPLDLPPTNLRTFGYWIQIHPPTVEKMREEKMWFSDVNDYGHNWDKQRNLTRERDQFRCRICGLPESGKPHHVHHKVPFRMFTDPNKANELDNLVTLCSSCHRLAEINVRIHSAISGLKYVLYSLSPLFVMCDENDLGAFADPAADFGDGQPVILLYDAIPAGMGLVESLYKKHQELLDNAHDLIRHCHCEDGCPSCVGPTPESGLGGKKETLYLLDLLRERRSLDGSSS
jgi:DEAD/DEAH box helicase domain-containing protein